MCSLGSAGAISVLCLAVIVMGGALLGFLLFISPLMIWLNLRRLRIALHEDLMALRVSLAAGTGAGIAPELPAGSPASNVMTADGAVSAPPAPAEEMIGFTCPECGKFFEGPAKLAGTDYTCPECHVSFHIH